MVPIPPRPIGDQTQQELDQLEADVAYLEGEGAARRYEWDSDQFWEWQAPFVAGGLAGGLNRDLLQDTRVMLAKKMEADDVQAIPVYGGMEEYGSTRKALRETCGDVDHALTLEITQSLPVPGRRHPARKPGSSARKSCFSAGSRRPPGVEAPAHSGNRA